MRHAAIALFLLGCWALPTTAEAADPPKLTEQQRKDLLQRWQELTTDANKQQRLGQAAAALQALEKALEVAEKLYPQADYPKGHADSALTLNALAVTLQSLGEGRKALPYFERAQAVNERLYGKKDHPDLAASLNNLGYVLQELGESRKALEYHERALAMRERLAGKKDDPDLVNSLKNVGYVLLELGEARKALGYYERALTMRERLYDNKDHPRLAADLNKMGDILDGLGESRKALDYYERALAMRERLYGKKDHIDLASSLHNVGSVLQDLGEARKALGYHERALAMLERLYGKKDAPQLAYSLHQMGSVLESLGEPRKALGYYERALEMFERLTEKKDHPDLAQCLNNLGAVLESLGESRKALDYHERALAMRERLYDKKDHPHLAESLNNMGHVLHSLGEGRKALGYHEKALAMYERLFDKKDHPHLASSLDNIGGVLHSLGEAHKALTFHERALAMRERLHGKKDHPSLVSSLNNMGYVLGLLGESRKALPYYERALAMTERLSGNKDDPDLALSLNNLGFVLDRLGEERKALDYFERGLAMFERLFDKKDHPHVASSLHNVGFVLEELGEFRKALGYHERALAMRERIYDKKDHPDLVASHYRVGSVLHFVGESRQGLGQQERALRMQRALIADRALSASEAEVLAFAASLPHTRDALLGASLNVEGSESRVYAQVWLDKANQTRILQARHLAARASKDDKTLALWEQLRQVRRDVGALLNTPGMNKEERDKQLRKLTDAKEDLERRLVERLPDYQVLQKSDEKGLDELRKALPADAVFIDLLRYHKIEKDSSKFHYAAFVVTRDKGVQRLELGAAGDIDGALAAWLKAIDAWKPGLPAKEEQDLLAEADRLGGKLSNLAWAPLAKHVPARALIYVSPDGDLARLPWAALPVGEDRVLVQEHLICQVPHGPFLLGRLTARDTPDDGKGKLLAVGGVDYGSADKPRFARLPGTETELKQVLELAAKRDKVGLQGKDASTAQVLELLGKARYVHLATHGEFKEALLAEERKRSEDQLKHWQGPSQTGTERVGLGLRSPLSYVGVALAQANQPDKAGPDGGVLSGETIVEQPLENLRLTVLSACETGLGAYTQGEGVQGLVRAFHVAGCPNVVASLWKVNDDATAALMAKFYRELWENGKSPAEALRSAQLLLYTNPEVVGTLARGVRGAPDFDKAVLIDSLKAEPTKGKRLPPKLWAAFLLSGTGQ